MYELDLARFKLYFIDLPSETGLRGFPISPHVPACVTYFYPALLKSVIMYSFFLSISWIPLLLFMKKALAKSHGQKQTRQQGKKLSGT